MISFESGDVKVSFRQPRPKTKTVEQDYFENFVQVLRTADILKTPICSYIPLGPNKLEREVIIF